MILDLQPTRDVLDGGWLNFSFRLAFQRRVVPATRVDAYFTDVIQFPDLYALDEGEAVAIGTLLPTEIQRVVDLPLLARSAI